MEKTKFRVLLIESIPEDSSQVRGILTELKSPDIELVRVDGISAGMEHITKGGIDVILVDLSLHESKGMDTFLKVHEKGSEIPIVVLTEPGEEKLGIDAMKRGAMEYIVKGEMSKELASRVIQYAIDHIRVFRVERELREIEKKFIDITENAHDWIWEIDADGRYTYSNSVVKEILGYEPQEILNKYFYEPFHPDDREDLKKIGYKTFAKKIAFRKFINRNVHKDGSIVWLSTSGVPILDDKGELKGYRGVDSDITEFKKIEGGLRESEEKLRSLLYSMDDLVFVFQRDGTFIEYYPTSAKEDLYIDPNEFIGKNFREILPPHTSRLIEAIIKEIISSGETQQFDYPLDIGGKKKWFHAKVSPVFDQENNLKEFIGVIRNITDRKNSMRALKQSEKRFHDIALSTADWIWEVDKDGKYIYVSGRVKQILGYSPDELIGKTPFDLMPEEEAKRVQEAFSDIASGKDPIVDLENWNLTRSGEKVRLLTNGVPILDDEGNLIGYRGVDKILNERKNG